MSSRNVVRRGSQLPSHLLLPGRAATSEAAERAIDLASVAGLELDEWQQDVLRGAMSERDDGMWAAFEVGVIVSRQNGKGSILEARQLAGLFVLGERLQIHTAHEFKTCFEHFRRVKDLVEGCDLLRKQVKIIRTGAGDQAIELTNGNRIRFLARSRSSGRGFSGDSIYLDEAFLLSDATMGALLPALSARPNPQIWYTSSAPHADSEVLHRVRGRGLAGGESRLYFAEWGCAPDCEPGDPENWYRANPALGVRIAEESIETEWRSLSAAEFGRERLGIPDLPDSATSVVDLDRWTADARDDGTGGLADPSSRIAERHCFALEVAHDRSWSAFGVAGLRADGRVHVEVVKNQQGTGWVVAAASELFGQYRVPIRIQSGSPAASFVDVLRERGVEVVEVSPGDHAEAVGRFLDAVRHDGLRHIRQGSLFGALKAAVLGSHGDASVWARRRSDGDISPLVAVTLALGGVAVPSVDLDPLLNVW